MSFKLYFAGMFGDDVEQVLFDINVNRLYSQLNDKRLGQKWLDKYSEETPFNIFVDSGAYTAHTKGKEIDVDAYIQYVNENKGKFQAIAQVDKIPGEFQKPKTLQQLAEAPELSWQNYLYMRERVIDVDCLLPVFHQGEDFKHLHRMLEFTENGKHIPYIGISPANDVSTKQKQQWFAQVFRVIRESNNPNVMTHAFGMTSLPVLESFPFYSADSTTWMRAAATGSICTPHGRILVSEQQVTNPQHINQLSHKIREYVEEQCKKYEVTLEECMASHAGRGIYNAKFHMEWAENYEFKGVKSFQRRLF